MTNDKLYLAHIGRALRDVRKSRSLSQEALAEVCGLHRTYVGSVERGERNISVINLRKMCEALSTRSSGVLALAEAGAAKRSKKTI